MGSDWIGWDLVGMGCRWDGEWVGWDVGELWWVGLTPSHLVKSHHAHFGRHMNPRLPHHRPHDHPYHTYHSAGDQIPRRRPDPRDWNKPTVDGSGLGRTPRPLRRP